MITPFSLCKKARRKDTSHSGHGLSMKMFLLFSDKDTVLFHGRITLCKANSYSLQSPKHQPSLGKYAAKSSLISVTLHHITSLIITVSSVNIGHFQICEHTFPGSKSYSDSYHMCRRCEFFGLRVTDTSDPSQRGNRSDLQANIHIVKVVLK